MEDFRCYMHGGMILKRKNIFLQEGKGFGSNDFCISVECLKIKIVKI